MHVVVLGGTHVETAQSTGATGQNLENLIAAPELSAQIASQWSDVSLDVQQPALVAAEDPTVVAAETASALTPKLLAPAVATVGHRLQPTQAEPLRPVEMIKAQEPVEKAKKQRPKKKAAPKKSNASQAKKASTRSKSAKASGGKTGANKGRQGKQSNPV